MTMTKEEILAGVKAGTPTLINRRRFCRAWRVRWRGSLYCKVSPKAATSLYGLQRMPVTLYAEQWERRPGISEELYAFLKQHDGELKRKQR